MKKIQNFKTILVITSLLLFAACSSKKPKANVSPDTPPQEITQSATDAGLSFEINADSDSKKAGTLKTIFFEFNSAILSETSKANLQNNIEFLKKYPTVVVQIEGHCDERGGVQYNIALGEKRAMNTKQYLVAAGISADRINTVSYGKERPLAFEHNDDSWSKNRRSNFVILSK